MTTPTESTTPANTSQIARLEVAADHFGHAVASLFKGLLHAVTVLAPVASVVGTAIGQPEVTAAADLASAAAQVAEKGVDALDTQK